MEIFLPQKCAGDFMKISQENIVFATEQETGVPKVSFGKFFLSDGKRDVYHSNFYNKRSVTQ